MIDQMIRIAQRMVAGEEFYSRLSPRLPPAIRKEMERCGLHLQSESPRHESTFYYPLCKEEFAQRLEEIVKHNETHRS